MSNSRSAINKRLDKLWSLVVRLPGKCARCGKTETLQAAHIHSRRNFATRWVIKNGICLCYACHFFWAHKEPVQFVEFIKNRLGQDVYDELKFLAGTSKHFEISELLEIEKQLKAALFFGT